MLQNELLRKIMKLENTITVGIYCYYLQKPFCTYFSISSQVK